MSPVHLFRWNLPIHIIYLLHLVCKLQSELLLHVLWVFFIHIIVILFGNIYRWRGLLLLLLDSNPPSLVIIINVYTIIVWTTTTLVDTYMFISLILLHETEICIQMVIIMVWDSVISPTTCLLLLMKISTKLI